MNLSQIVQDNAGQMSSMRAVFVMLVVYIVGINLSFNVMALIRNTPIVALPLNDIIALIGVAMAKVGQSFSENKKVGA
jgi:hypothetical protein